MGLEPGSETAFFGRYRVVGLLGEGGAGQVYACHDPLLDRQVALKVLYPGLDPDLLLTTLERFRVELKVFGRISHPHVVGVFDANLESERPYLVMELCSGPTVSDWLAKGGPCSMGQAALLVHQAALALDHLHAQGIVHRDVKPANLLFHQQSLKLTDFGVAQARFLTPRYDERVVGTPGYMPPEQLRGETATPQSDVFSLAATLFELLTGQRPFSGDHTSVLYERVFDEVPAITALSPDLTPDFDEFFEKALAKDPLRRYGSCAELSDALAHIVPEGELEAFDGLTGGRAAVAPTTWTYGKAARSSARYVPLRPLREPSPPSIPATERRSGAVPPPWMTQKSNKSTEASAAAYEELSFELLGGDTFGSSHRLEGIQTLQNLKSVLDERHQTRPPVTPRDLPFSPQELEPFTQAVPSRSPRSLEGDETPSGPGQGGARPRSPERADVRTTAERLPVEGAAERTTAERTTAERTAAERTTAERTTAERTAVQRTPPPTTLNPHSARTLLEPDAVPEALKQAIVLEPEAPAPAGSKGRLLGLLALGAILILVAYWVGFQVGARRAVPPAGPAAVVPANP